MRALLRIVGLLAILGTVLFAAVQPVRAGSAPPCTNPYFAMWDDGYYYDNLCKNRTQGLLVDPNSPSPGKMVLYDGFITATIYGIPGTHFKAFLYQVAPTPKNTPEGWYVFGYGADIFYDDTNVNPEGMVCFGIPKDLTDNHNFRVYGYDGTDFYFISTGTCGYFQGGGQFFLLIDVDPSSLIHLIIT